ncbi:MAG TPA: hypothetical protein VGL18_02215 [Actinomycetota bacterium]|jgi:hypothetical protein
MAKTQLEGGGRPTTWRNPVLRFEESCRASADAVYDLLEDLQSHLEWAGQRQLETTRLLTLEAPAGPAGVGTEFFTTGSDGKVARWTDRSVVTEATRPEVFEFVTEGRREGKPGSRPWLSTAVHRYEIAADSSGCRVTYTEELTRLAGAPRILLAPGISRILFRISAKYMRRGFDGLLALAEERSGTR